MSPRTVDVAGPATLAVLVLAAFVALVLLAAAGPRWRGRGACSRSAARRAASGPPAAGARAKRVVLGVDERGRPVRLARATSSSAHGLILGASGAGKTTTLLDDPADQIRRGRPVVAIDMKGSPAFARDARGRRGRRRAPVHGLDARRRAHWNPLAHGNATELKDKLIATERFTEPHYQRAAERYVQTVLQVLGQRPRRTAADASEVVALMDPRRLADRAQDLDRPLARAGPGLPRRR